MNATRDAIEAVLRKLPFAADWPDGTISQVAALAEHASFPAGAVIFHEGDEHEAIQFVLEGRVALEMSVPARGRIRLLTLSPGDLLGWSPLVGNREMTATAVALEDVRLLKISGSALLALCDRNHDIGFAVMQRLAGALARRLSATRLQLLDLYSHSAPLVMAVATGKA
ncbi:MAG TPA: cyclic nucleotide-binding domain-containing protein [Planctomycetaceae bacterium]|jgi:CRP-like cAMP-binding protein|nr:cyclic nucleotide-binding domain-containing protein [Planctomycetaceae bacterium]